MQQIQFEEILIENIGRYLKTEQIRFVVLNTEENEISWVVRKTVISSFFNRAWSKYSETEISFLFDFFINVFFQDQNTGNGYIDQTIPQRDVEEMISMQPNVSFFIHISLTDGENKTGQIDVVAKRHLTTKSCGQLRIVIFRSLQ